MRLLVEILIVGGLVYLGWEKPFKRWTDELLDKVILKQAAPAS
jgi:hypothetical protein